MSGHYRPYRGSKRRKRRGSGYTLRLRLAVCAAILAAAIGVRYAFPQFTQAIYTRLFRQADYSAAFSSIGGWLNGESGFGESMREAFSHAFSAKTTETDGDADSAGESEESGGNIEVTEVYNGPVAAAFAARQAELGETELPEDAAEEMLSLPQMDMVNPLSGELISGYGYRLDPISQDKRFHYGVDIRAQEGAEVSAFARGVVTVAGESTTLGYYLIIEQDGLQTQYDHLSEILVSSGQSVNAGDIIGRCGSTGNVSEAMLHFEINYNGKYVNPEYYLSWQTTG
ncbi:MAG: M23 family metallopeptidase [Oscillospiraceae bacterium]|nr:M23 family metallopeptidase [Oscillospiraceae bacterium]